MKFLPEKKKLVVFAIFALGYILLIMFLLTLRKPVVQQKVPVQHGQSFVAPTKLSEQTTVTEKVIASKIDLERKMIAPRSPQDIARIRSVIEKQGGKIIEAKGSVLVADLPKDVEEKVTKELTTSQAIKGVEVDYPTFLSADNPDWGVKRIAAPDVWQTTSGSGLRVAVVDTGVDYGHPELRGRYAGGYDTANNDSDPFDDHGHGTHVAGIVASDLNGGGLAGVAPGVQIVAIKALSADGSGYLSDLVEAIDWGIANNVQVMNFSLGSSYNSQTLANKVAEASSRGMLLIAAAGNTGGGSLMYPAAYGSVISVAATDSSDRIASFSSLGAEIAAPGVGITSAVPGGGYATWSGTSMAAPHVTATVALMLANKQTNIRQQLHDTAIDLGPAGRDSYYGYGLVHAKPAALGKDTLSPLITFLEPASGTQVKGNVAIKVSIQDEYKVASASLTINNAKVKEWASGPYEYTWETDTLVEGDYTLLAQAFDENGNSGEARITLSVSRSAISPTKALSVTRAQGRSAAVRQDTQNSTAIEHRQNAETPATERKQEQQAPETSNVNERNQKAEPPPQANNDNEKENQGKKDVKGASTSSLTERIKAFFFSLF